MSFRMTAMMLGFAAAATPCGAQSPVDYARQVKPVLQSRCYACHGALKQEAGLRLDTARQAIQGGDSGAAIKPSDPDASLLLKRVTETDESLRMPPEGEPLKPAEIANLKDWILQGAVSDPAEKPERDPRDHWAFRTPERPSVPLVPDPDWSRHPIDAFISRARLDRNLTPAPAADKKVWLRRVSLDLVGLPPTGAELDEFLADESDDAFDRVVTRLLDSPQYGERWGRHWMDIWRYSDWWGLGAEVRNSQKHIWHWRDWIIESLNADKGYDQMLREMLAADELYPNDLDKLRASGFLARQYFRFNRTSWLDETIEHTSKAMLGLTFNCCKCHDHKYDPIAQTDYYRMRAIFEPYQVRTDNLPGEIDIEKDGLPRAFDCHLDAVTHLHVRGDDRNPDLSRQMAPELPAFLPRDGWLIEPIALPVEAHSPGTRAFVLNDHLQQAERKIQSAREAVEVARKQYATAVEANRIAETLDGPADALSAIARPIAADTFASERPDFWEVREGQWSYRDGCLKQTQSDGQRGVLRLKRIPPTDFEARLKYVPTGGQMWKSVGISFDVTDSQNEILAYLSSYAAGSKSQIAYRQQAGYVYPPSAAQARPVELNKPHEMILRVRGTLVNVMVDGTHSLAYQLPIPRQAGALELITFDATAEFHEFELTELSESAILVSPPTATGKQPTGPSSLAEATLALAIAEKTLATAEAQPASLRARVAADRMRFLDPQSPELATRIDQAVRAERLAAIARADEDYCRAELESLRAPAGKKQELDQKLMAARMNLETARKAALTPGQSYNSLPGALKTPESNLETDESRRKPYPETSTGRRTALANWLTHPRNPLAARVAVNHIWARHFGKPLVPTVFDFGRKGTPPTHPELLDWLAVEFRESGWSMKHLHRQIVTSKTYRLTSSSAFASPETVSADPENRYYWRANPVRMEAQLVRDSLLHLAGDLDLTRGGPSIPVGAESRRRSLYFVHSHNEHQKFLSIFDDASVLECYRRAESIVPQQALALENSPLALEMADKIAARLTKKSQGSSDAQFVRAAFLEVLSAAPSDQEQVACLESMALWQDVAKRANRPDPVAFARAGLVHVLLNHNDFVTIR